MNEPRHEHTQLLREASERFTVIIPPAAQSPLRLFDSDFGEAQWSRGGKSIEVTGTNVQLRKLAEAAAGHQCVDANERQACLTVARRCYLAISGDIPAQLRPRARRARP
jgi:hypothetical protein